MHLTLARGVALSLLLLASVAPGEDAHVRDLIRDLGNADPSKREAATQELEKLGDADESGSIERAVEEASHDPDPERVQRCAQVLRHIRWWDRIAVNDAGAVDLDTGTFLWGAKFGRRLAVRRSGRTSLAWMDLENDGISCVDLRSGKATWSLHERGGSLVRGEYLLQVDGESLSRLSLDKGERLWKTALQEDFTAVDYERGDPEPMAADRDLVCLGSTSLYAYDAATGKLRWTREKLSPRGGMLLDDDGVYACVDADEDHSDLHRLDRASGKDLWTQRLPSHVYGNHVIEMSRACGLVLATCGENCETPWTVAVEKATGKTPWTLGRRAIGCWVEPEGKRAWIPCVEEVQVIDLADGSTCARFPFGKDEGLGDKDVVFLPEGQRLYVLDSGPIDCHVRVACFDVPSRKREWVADTRGVVESRGSDNAGFRAGIERLGSFLVAYDNDCFESLVVVLDPSNGAIVSHFVVKVEDRDK